ncbi:hypothetical protein [Sulfurimonas sp.]|uniref:hypothetical protein n=1 Tax=Sulfurimonas sp. TaxID=2022749 RepID=UPI0025F13829|nr:hypothetical protein [Sulfurimonas sp.]
MKKILLILLFVNLLVADTLKVYFYTTEAHIKNFKSLKVGFDKYLTKYGDYKFQPFNDKKTFEKYIKDKNSIVVLSSWHYQKISKEYGLKAKLVAEKKSTIKDTKILVGHIAGLIQDEMTLEEIPLKGIVTSAYDDEYTKELLSMITQNHSDFLSVLIVPKEIDALMSVGFGMSKFALVSRDSLSLLKKINPFLAKSLKVYKESNPTYRMFVASNKMDEEKLKLISIFENMNLNNNGKDVLKMIAIDKLIVLNADDLKNIGGAK